MIQILINIVISGSIISLVAVSFFMVYKITGFFHFAHAIIIVLGAYFTYFWYKVVNMPLPVSIPLAIICSCMVGCLTEYAVYKPLRKQKAKSLILLLASLGIYIAIQNIISQIFGDDTKSFRSWQINEGIDLLGAKITLFQIIQILVNIIALVFASKFIIISQSGKEIRAVANDSELAKISGLNSDKVILLSFAIGSSLAAVAGILVAFDSDMTPTMGMNYLMMGVVAMIIGGGKSIWGIMGGSLFLAIFQNLGAWYISSQWQEAITFAILLVFLLIKPEGITIAKTKSAVI